MTSSRLFKIITIGISFFVLSSILLCGSIVPVNFGNDHVVMSDCSFTITGISAVDRILLAIIFIYTLVGLTGGSILHRFILQLRSRILPTIQLSPIPNYLSRNFLYEALRKGLIHPQIYSFVIV